MINPVTMPFDRYQSEVCNRLSIYGVPPRPVVQSLWRTWAMAVIAIPQVQRNQPPDPQRYDDWREWGLAFNRILDLGLA
jgi:hypothetical protein